MLPTLSPLSNAELLERTKNLKGEENHVVADVVLHLHEIDSRGIYRDAGYSSLFAYCRGCLGYSEGAAFRRVRAARSLAQSPEIYQLIREGKLSLCALSEVSQVMTEENRDEVLSVATGASKREAARIAAQFGAVKPSKRESIRVRKVELTANAVDLFTAQGGSPGKAAPVIEERHSLSFEVSSEVAALYEEAKILSGSSSVAEVFGKTLREYVERKRKERTVRVPKSAVAAKVEPVVVPGSHSIPISVRREVFERDAERCTYVSPDGHRCCERQWLEIDHVVPVARGGSNGVGNLRVLCRAHNQLLAEQWFGKDYIVRRRLEARGGGGDGATFAGESARD